MDDKFDINRMMREDKEKGINYDPDMMKAEETLIELQKTLDSIGLTVVSKEEIKKVEKLLKALHVKQQEEALTFAITVVTVGFIAFRLGRLSAR